MVDSCQDDGVCKPEIFVHVEMDGGIIGNDFFFIKLIHRYVVHTFQLEVSPS